MAPLSWNRYFSCSVILILLTIGVGLLGVDAARCDEKSAVCGPECVATERILNLYGLYASASILASLPRINSVYVLCFSRESRSRTSSDIFCMTGTMDEMQSVQPQHVLTIPGKVTNFEEFHEDSSQYILIHSDAQPVQLYEVIQDRSFVSLSFVHSFGGQGAIQSVVVKVGTQNAVAGTASSGVLITTTSGRLCGAGDLTCLSPTVHTLVGAALTQCTVLRSQAAVAVQLIAGWNDGTTGYVAMAAPLAENSPLFGLQLYRLAVAPTGECRLEPVQDVLGGEPVCGVRTIEVVKSFDAKTYLLVSRQPCPDPQTGLIPAVEANVILKLWDAASQQLISLADPAARELSDTTGVMKITAISDQFFLCQRESTPSTIHVSLLPTESKVVSTVRINNQATVKAVQSRNGDVFLTHVTSIGSVVVDWLSCTLNQNRPSNYSMTPYNNNRAKVLSRNPIYQDNSRYTGRPLNMAQNAEQSNAPYAAVPRPRYNGPAVPPPPQDRYQPNNQPPPAGPVDAVAANHRGPNYFHVQPPSAYVPLEVSADQVPNTRQNPYTGGGEMQLEPQPYYPEGAGPPPYQGAPPPPPAQDVNPYSFSGYGPPPQPVAQPVYQPQPSWQQSYPQPGPFYAPQGSFGGGQPTPYGNGYGPSPPVYPFYPPPSPQGPTYFNFTRYSAPMSSPPVYQQPQYPSNLVPADVNPNYVTVYGARPLPMAPQPDSYQQQPPPQLQPPPQYQSPNVPFPSLGYSRPSPTTRESPTPTTLDTTTANATVPATPDVQPQIAQVFVPPLLQIVQAPPRPTEGMASTSVPELDLTLPASTSTTADVTTSTGGDQVTTPSLNSIPTEAAVTMAPATTVSVIVAETSTEFVPLSAQQVAGLIEGNAQSTTTLSAGHPAGDVTQAPETTLVGASAAGEVVTATQGTTLVTSEATTAAADVTTSEATTAAADVTTSEMTTVAAVGATSEATTAAATTEAAPTQALIAEVATTEATTTLATVPVTTETLTTTEVTTAAATTEAPTTTDAVTSSAVTTEVSTEASTIASTAVITTEEATTTPTTQTTTVAATTEAATTPAAVGAVAADTVATTPEMITLSSTMASVTDAATTAEVAKEVVGAVLGGMMAGATLPQKATETA